MGSASAVTKAGFTLPDAIGVGKSSVISIGAIETTSGETSSRVLGFLHGGG